jgi:cellulose synthase (UDP-forming)
VPRHLGRLPWALRLRFLYSLAYYPLLAVTTIVGLALSPIAAVTDRPWIDVPYGQFLLRWALVSVWLVAIVLLLRARRLLRPATAPVFSWENALYTLTRWPLNVWGVCAAVLQRIRPRPITFKVTPKGAGGLERFPVRLTMPYAVLSVLLTGSALYAEWATRAVGYAFLCLLGGLGYAVVTVVVPLLHAREAGRAAGAGFPLGRTALPATALGLGCLVLAGFAAQRFPAYLTSVFDPDTLLRVLGF